MRIANLNGRAVVVDGDRAFDIAEASDGQFGPAPRSVFDAWAEFTAWATNAELGAGVAFTTDDLDAPIPDPRQVFAIGLNYRDHADEANLAYPDHPVVFTKFASSLAGPNVTVELPSDNVDYENELVVVIGTQVHDADPAEAMKAVAGYAVGQDYSEREVQRRGPAAQFSLGKSFPNFGPFGPAVVTLDELDNPAALRVTTVLERDGDGSGEFDGTTTLQDGTTADFIFPVDRAVSELSRIVTLFPGDIIFTGTPAGVGMPRGLYLRSGDTLTSTIEGVGSLRNTFVDK